MQKLDYIQVLNKDVTFTNEKREGRSIATFEATILKRDTTISDQEVKTRIIEHLKQNMQYPYENIYEVYQIHVVED